MPLISASLVILTLVSYSQSTISPESSTMHPSHTNTPELSKESETFDIPAFLKVLNKPENLARFQGDEYVRTITPEQVVALTKIDKESMSTSDFHAYSSAFIQTEKITKHPGYDLFQHRDYHTLRYMTYRFDKDSALVVVKEFNGKGMIRSKYLAFYGKEPVGIGYEYDDNGKFLREVDYDKGYTFKYDQVLEYFQKECTSLL